MIQITNASKLREADGYWYVATPYTHYIEGHEAAYLAACAIDDMLMHAGVRRFTPIVHTHEIAMTIGIDTLDHDFWMSVDQPFIERAFGLIVVDMEGWRDSVGVTLEREFFEAAKRPIYLLDPLAFEPDRP